MSTETRKSCRIARRADQQGARPLVGNQAKVKKCVTGTTLPQPQALQDNQNETSTQNGSVDADITQSSRKQTRQKWTMGEYKQVMTAYYQAVLEPSDQNNTKYTYQLWREMNTDVRPNIDANKLANVRRDIVKNKRLSDSELEAIKSRIRANIKSTKLPVNSDATKGTNNEEDVVEREIDAQSDPVDEVTDREDTVIDQSTLLQVELMKQMILEKWEEVKETDMKDRSSLPKIYLNRKAKGFIKLSNKAVLLIKDSCGKSLGINELNELIFASACVTTEMIGKKVIHRQQRKRKQPLWKAKLERDIKELRIDLSMLTELTRNNGMGERKSRKIRRKYSIRNDDNIITAKEEVRQLINAKAQRIRRFEKRVKQFRQNRTFATDTKRFYRELGKKKIEVNKPPTAGVTEQFWKLIWEDEKHHNEEAEWVRKQEELGQKFQEQTWPTIEKQEVISAIKKTHNWKSPGQDKIPNFWLKNLTSLHEDIACCFSNIVKNPEESPSWLTNGITYLLPKSEETIEPKNYRPITCLPTMYKILTAIIADRAYDFLNENQAFPIEQKGCKKESYGCKDQLLINKMILEHCRKGKRNLSTAWIDYKKAFDSVPNSWILKTMEMYKLSPVLINFMRHIMGTWKTTMILNYSMGNIMTNPISIKNGIFQGDSLSPLIFCLALAPLSNLLNNTGMGYNVYNEE